MSNEDVLSLLRTITDNSKTMLENYKDVSKVQKECYQELIKTYEKMIEQDKLITALAKEVINLQERVSKLEGKKAGDTVKVRSKIKKINEELREESKKEDK